MSEDKRKRSPNWLPTEKELLLSIVTLHFDVVENKKIDTLSMKAKFAQWKIIADEYNSQTEYNSRSVENLKAQWESMKKVARKEAATNSRKQIIQKDASLTLPKNKDDINQRIFNLLSNNAVGSSNSYDIDIVIHPDSANPAMSDFPESPQTPVITTLKIEKMSDEDASCDERELAAEDWGKYPAQFMGTVTPVSQTFKVDDPLKTEARKQTHRTSMSRRPAHTLSPLKQLHKKKMEAIDLKIRLALEEVERSKTLHDLDIQIKNEILKQEKIKSHMLLVRRNRILALKKANHRCKNK